MKKSRSDVLGELAREEARLAALRSQAEQSAARVAVLQTALGAFDGDSGTTDNFMPVFFSDKPPAADSEKIALFRSLFRGRADVFPRRWENTKRSRSGYSPACTNEWDEKRCAKARRGRGDKARGACGDCPNRIFLPVTDDEIKRHLQGRQVIGVYPLLPDETCWFLAADFDGDAWREDVSAFVESCHRHKIAAAVERSRSGNGAHVWFFFSAPIPAVAARKLGCFIITETMARRHQLTMRSYDRLFPNQDTLPKGGFGNLIALPLQHEARQIGNSVFLNDALQPFSDQWAFLAGVQRLDPSFVLALAEEATRTGQVIGARANDLGDEYASAPWIRPPSGRTSELSLDDPIPREVQGVLAQRLFVEKEGLPSSMLNRIKLLAAFQNPVFCKKQALRLSTALTPRVIACAEDLERFVSVPRGCREDVETLLAKHGSALTIKDERSAGAPLSVEFQGTLTPTQAHAARALLAHDAGVLVAPPGLGKTVIGAFLVAARRCSTLILVHRKPLLDQWIVQLSRFLGIGRSEIGQIGAGKRKPNGCLDVAMIQSLVRKGKVDDIVADYGHVITDECHHVGAFSFERVLSEVKAKYVTGLTATPQRRDGWDPILRMQLGPVRFAVGASSQTVEQPFARRLVVRNLDSTAQSLGEGAGIQEIYAALAADDRRNRVIIDDVVSALAEGRSPILLTERRDHLDLLADRLQGAAKHLVVLQGGMKSKERRATLARLAAIPENETRLLLATGRYIGEGFDDARLDTLFLALPISWKGTLVQYSGRLHRPRPDKREVRIYDYVDRSLPVLRRMFQRRLRGYRAIGYAATAPQSFFGCEETAPPFD